MMDLPKGAMPHLQPIQTLDTHQPSIMDVHQLEKQIAYSFQDRSLLEEALRHSSYINEHPTLSSNERLEFLGDTVLNLVVSDLLMALEPPLAEGVMTRIRAHLVNEATLAEIAKHLRLGELLLLGKGELQSNGREKHSILADACEALIAAVYLDGGFEAAHRMVKRLYASRILPEHIDMIGVDYKSKLQEMIQGSQKAGPVYRLIRAFGPDHEKCFVVQVTTAQGTATGQGKNKKAAEQDAARNALRTIYGIQ
ncbi:MAG: ribonuclease III [Thermodesulfobacteriota bacterium]